MSGKMWGGRFAEATAASVEAFSASIQYDARLYHHDIMGSKAHARMLAKQGLIAATETVALLMTGNGLKDIQSAVKAAGAPTFIEPRLAAVKAALVE